MNTYPTRYSTATPCRLSKTMFSEYSLINIIYIIFSFLYTRIIVHIALLIIILRINILTLKLSFNFK